MGSHACTAACGSCPRDAKCNMALNLCVECVVDGDCSPPERCDPMMHACIRCPEDADHTCQ